jgi:protein SCO1
MDAVGRHFGLAAAIVFAVSAMGARAEVAEPDSARAIELSQSVIGNRIGDYAFTDSYGRPRRLADYRGKPLLVTFVYTGCSQVCPTTVRFLDGAVREARRTFGPGSFAIVTIGFNQPFDTPQAMRAFAGQHRITDPDWDFLSPAPDRVEALTRAFGFTWYATPKGFDHVTQVTVLDGEGRVYRQIYGESFQIPMLIEPLKQIITGAPVPAGDWRMLVEKVRLFCTVYDRSSGRYRLDYSLFVGMAIGLLILGAGVTSLLREWRSQRAG